MINKPTQLKRLILSALFVAIAILLPLPFHSVPDFGKVFLPMHIPVLLCGFLCGSLYAGLCGVLSVFLSSMITGMPPQNPVVLVPMMLELAAYGILAGIMYKKTNAILALITAMIGGRLVLGAATAVILGVSDKPFVFNSFITAAFVTSLPGIVIQIVLIPAVIIALEKGRLIQRS